jgi:plastocyanin
MDGWQTMRWSATLLLILVLAMAAGCATTGGPRSGTARGRVIHGRLEVSKTLAGGAKPVRAGMSDVVVYVEPVTVKPYGPAPAPARKTQPPAPRAVAKASLAPQGTKVAAARSTAKTPAVKSARGAAAPTAPRATMLTRENDFAPRVLAVTAGTVVEFKNGDRVFHNAFSLSPAKRFDLGKLGPGQAREVTFDRPGLVSLFCELHPASAGFVVVVPGAFARADSAGSFTLPPLPPGAYVVKAWHPRWGERRARVHLTSADLAILLRF